MQALGAAMGPSNSKIANVALGYLNDQSRTLSELQAASARKDQVIETLKDERHELKIRVATLEAENRIYRRTTNASKIFILTGTGLFSVLAWPLFEQKQYVSAVIAATAGLALVVVGWLTQPPEKAQK